MTVKTIKAQVRMVAYIPSNMEELIPDAILNIRAVLMAMFGFKDIMSSLIVISIERIAEDEKQEGLIDYPREDRD